MKVLRNVLASALATLLIVGCAKSNDSNGNAAGGGSAGSSSLFKLGKSSANSSSVLGVWEARPESKGGTTVTLRIGLRATEVTAAALCTTPGGTLMIEVTSPATVDETSSKIVVAQSQSQSIKSPDGKGQCNVSIKAAEMKYELKDGSLYFMNEMGSRQLVSDNKIAD